MNKNLQDMTLNELLAPAGIPCACGQTHQVSIREILLERGAITQAGRMGAELGMRAPLLVADANTWRAAGQAAAEHMRLAGLSPIIYVFPGEVRADAEAIGQVLLHAGGKFDGIAAVGGGTIHDICKIIAHAAHLPLLYIATAPSMDGYASNSASMLRDGVKTSIYCKAPDAILADTDILRHAPLALLQAGMGDMLAKTVSLCEWRIASVVCGEPFCPEVAGLVRASLNKCIAGTQGFARREPQAVEAVAEGLILSGLAMSFVNISRPASGLEHYISHMWDMRAIRLGEREHLHGIQVGVATLLTLQMYAWLEQETPDEARATAHAAAFSQDEWETRARRLFGRGADAIIALEAQEHKYDASQHAKRFETLCANWHRLLAIMDEELLPLENVQGVMDLLGAPTTPEALGLDAQDTCDAITASGDIRDKYVLSRLLWDLGLLEAYAKKVSSGG